MSLFNPKQIEEEKINYEKITFSPEHSAMMNGIAETILQYININKMALKGFIWRAIKDTQVAQKTQLHEVSTMTPENRAKFALASFENLKGYLIKILNNSEDESKILEAVDKGIKFYTEKYMYRE